MYVHTADRELEFNSVQFNSCAVNETLPWRRVESKTACLAHQSIRPTSTAPTYLPATFNSSLSMVDVTSAHSYSTLAVLLSETEVLLSQDHVCGTVYRLLQDRSPATDSFGYI